MGGDMVVWFLVGGVVLLVGRRFRRILAGDGCGGGGCARTCSCDESEGVRPVWEDAE